MIDIHTHVLPELDDGAKNQTESAEILQMLVEQGVNEIVFTPHYYGKKRPLEQFLKQREESLQKLETLLPEGLKTHLGAEVHMTGVNDPSDEALCALAIENSTCVLVEFPFTEKWQKSLLERLESFITDTGYTPIVAHIERYEAVRKNPALISELVKIGCLIQMNTTAFLDRHSRRFAYALLKHGLVHCLGTDTHDTQERKPDYAAAKAAVTAAGYASEWQRIQSYMRKMLAGDSLRITYEPVRKIFGRFV